VHEIRAEKVNGEKMEEFNVTVDVKNCESMKCVYISLYQKYLLKVISN
jgi:hypothetical protein